MKCPSCGQEVEQGAAQCPACGAGLGGEAFVTCYRCGTALPEPNARQCPHCGRYQYRVCYCGKEIYKGWATCPHCGADWSHRLRTKERRRSRRYRRVFRPSQLYTYILGGVLVGAILLPSLSWGVGRLWALWQGAPPGEARDVQAPSLEVEASPPDDVITRIQQGIGEMLQGAFWRLVGFLSALWLLVHHHPALFGGAVLGGVGGAVLYLYESGRIRIPGLPHRPLRRKRRKRGYYD